jgi:hypothetical protein
MKRLRYTLELIVPEITDAVALTSELPDLFASALSQVGHEAAVGIVVLEEKHDE